MLVIKEGTGKFRDLTPEELNQIIGNSIQDKRKEVEFRQYGQKDAFKKEIVFPNLRTIPKSFTRTVGGKTVTFAYCQDVQVVDRGGYQKEVLHPYKPAELNFKGQSIRVPREKIDLLAFLMIHPQNTAQKNGKGRGIFYMHDYAAEAKADAKSERAIISLKNRIWNEYSLDELSAYLEAKGRRQTRLMTDEEIRSAASKMAEKNYETFDFEIRSSSVTIKADINRFKESGIVVIKEINGKREWRIGFGEEKGDPICAIEPAVGEIDSLAKFLLNNLGTYDAFKKELVRRTGATGSVVSTPVVEKRVTEPQTTSEYAETASRPVDTQERPIVSPDYLIETGRVKYNKLRKTVEMVDIDGVKIPKSEGGDLFVAKSADSWVAEFKEKMDKDPEFAASVTAKV